MTLAFVLAIAMAAAPATGPADRGVFFGETFGDADLAQRGWYDTGAFRIVNGSVEYE